jgi:hypothetical protein
MEESLLSSIARNVSKQCYFSDDEIKDLFYIFKVDFNKIYYFYL